VIIIGRSPAVGDVRGDRGPLMLTGVGISVSELMEIFRLCSCGTCMGVGFDDISVMMS
jgi:hypothetical protein